MITASQVIPLLKRVKGNGPQWTSLCPAHSDKNRSLSIAQIGPKLLMHCHAGCTFDAIVSALGISKIDNSGGVVVANDAKLAPVARPLAFVGEMWAAWAAGTGDSEIDAFAGQLGLSAVGLRAVGCCNAWPYESWGFPMYSHMGNFTGMRLRSKEGNGKWSMPGGKEGIFLTFAVTDPFFIVEGPTDLAALVDLGFNGLGRPNCSGAVKDIVAYCQDRRIKPIIIADGDEPGIKGATELCKCIVGAKTWQLPAKDCRAFVNEGGTREEFESGLRCIL